MRDGWSETTLGMVTTHFRGTVKVEDGIPYPASGVMMEGRGLIDREPFIGGISGYKKLTPIAPGQLVLRSITAWEAPITVVPVGYIGRHVSGVFPVLNLDESQLDAGFMGLVCQWPVFWNEMRMRATGSVLRRKTLSANQLQQIPLNLPPLAEQKRIVDVVSSVDAYVDALQQQADTARTARNAVLHELLSAGGDDWTETTLGDVLAIQSGFAFSTNDWAVEGYPVIKINNVRDGKVSTESCSYIADPIPQGAEKFLLKTGDLLITLTGEIGATGTVDQTFPMYLNQRVGRVSILKESKVLLQYLAVLFNYAPVRAEMWSLGKGNAQLNISPKSIHEIEVNLPPLMEQKRIVEIVLSMDDVIQSTEQAVADAKNLRSGLLSDLLSGEHEIPVSYDVFVGAA
jgi:type I restriction enzyme S subunit